MIYISLHQLSEILRCKAYAQFDLRTEKHASMYTLMKAVIREWAKIPQNYIRKACGVFFSLLKAIFLGKGDHIEIIAIHFPI